MPGLDFMYDGIEIVRTSPFGHCDIGGNTLRLDLRKLANTCIHDHQLSVHFSTTFFTFYLPQAARMSIKLNVSPLKVMPREGNIYMFNGDDEFVETVAILNEATCYKLQCFIRFQRLGAATLSWEIDFARCYRLRIFQRSVAAFKNRT